MNKREEVMNALRELVGKGGGALSPTDRVLLKLNIERALGHKERIADIGYMAFIGFFHCAAESRTFVSEERIEEKYGKSLRDNYPEANESFLNFAKTYWTLKMVVENIDDDMDWAGAEIITKIEVEIAGIFFPTPGPAEMHHKVREKMQREVIKNSKAKIDIDEFIRGNPILLRDKSRQRGLYWKIFKKRGF